jgi:peptidoglycan hydrolase-like amidase
VLALVSISVFGLFHPTVLEVRPLAGNVLVVESKGRSQVLEGKQSARLESPSAIAGRGGDLAAFTLSVPGKISREFFGRLEVRQEQQHLVAIVWMDPETAVASIVAAESPPSSPLEARKAQAVLARSFLEGARGRHPDFDFCDTTHCQFLREPPPAAHPARQAQEQTVGLVLRYQGRVIPALYSADCGGHTRSLEEAGWQAEEYPYFGVACPVRGATSGHRIGLCQVGSAELARRGATFREILVHYFPAATIEVTR